VTRLYIFDDATARDFEPFCLSRPIGELRAGVELIRARWEQALGIEAVGFIGASHLSDFEEPGAPPAVAADEELPAGSIVANARCVVSLREQWPDASTGTWRCGDRVAAVRLAQPARAPDFSEEMTGLDRYASGSESAIAGRWLSAAWELIGTLPEQLAEDIPAFALRLAHAGHGEARVLGDHPVFIESGATVEPWVVLDATAGPILIRTGASVSSFTRIVGPCYIGEHTTIIGDRVAACSIGDTCKVRGEISNSIVLGHSNKGHSGFVGHSYLGRWVNLGAGTTTSNLKNTYGQVQLATRHGPRDTGLQFLGTLLGDHVKTGIGTMLTTGTLLGVGVNVFGAAAPPKRVPAFAWGESAPYQRFEREKFVAVAERVMARRNVTLSERAARHLRNVYDLAAEENPSTR
jgi:UDP-N-acetylglucosamine diphosphorylase / glucose-1-phosphate thymidylyltransferase / UDP-N-acetylgalactosamine diphosphorylase / glucosamine-1-phosphate N-acetyltransferase / galactosamine-1-phosphate N-acetyltransferase